MARDVFLYQGPLPAVARSAYVEQVRRIAPRDPPGLLDRDAEVGKRFGLSYAEPYHYIGPPPSKIEDYVKANAVKL